MKRSIPLLTRRSALVGATAFVASPYVSLAQQQEVLKFGVADPLTGPSAIFGLDQIQAVRWAIEDINAKGGVNGRKLEGIIVDHQAKPEVGIAVVQRLINVDKVPVFFTAFSNVVKAVAPIANREKVLMLSVGANSPDVKTLGDYVYTTFPLADIDMKALGKYMVQKQGKKRAAVLFVNHETGIEGAKIFRQAFIDAGGEVVLNESYEEMRSDFTGLVLKVRAANPDMVHVHSVVSDFTAVVRQMRQLGLNMQVTSFQTAFNPKMIEELGSRRRRHHRHCDSHRRPRTMRTCPVISSAGRSRSTASRWGCPIPSTGMTRPTWSPACTSTSSTRTCRSPAITCARPWSRSARSTCR